VLGSIIPPIIAVHIGTKAALVMGQILTSRLAG
jgi:hypothetical protein